jgi:hypothetical protein
MIGQIFEMGKCGKVCNKILAHILEKMNFYACETDDFFVYLPEMCAEKKGLQH